MKEKLRKYRSGRWAISLFILVVGALFAVNVMAATIRVSVVDQDGKRIRGFKYLLEENNTNPPEPGVHKPVDTTDVYNNTLSLSIHKGNAAVVASGETTGTRAVIRRTDGGNRLEDGRYFVSVIPFGTADKTYDMGGAAVDTTQSRNVTVYVRENPIPTAQLSIHVFEDGNGGLLNNVWDIGEPGLAGFAITLTDQAGDVLEDAFGNPLCGDGHCETDANGEVIIQNLAPNKYGIEAVPPPGEGWLQVSTLEGTRTIDAWVRPNEPPFLVEFGPPFWHASFGFTKEQNNLPVGGSTITGQVVKAHLSRPPAIDIFPGPPPEGEAIGERCIVGLNDLEQGILNALWVGKCEDGTGNFTIPNVAAGTYQVVVFDVSLLHIITFTSVIVDGVSDVNMGQIITPMWFGIQEHNVFFDDNGNNVLDPGEQGIPDQVVNLRYRDGTIYQSFPTDTSGFVPFQTIFPLFHWYITEVDFARYKATGLRAVNDLGGEIPAIPDADGKRNPEENFQTGTALLEAFQLFAGQNQKFEWSKELYGMNENGGISGIIYYATTRAEADPRLAAGDPWEPGIPRVQVSLYRDVVCNSNGAPALYPGCPEATPNEVGDGIPDPKDPAATFPYTPEYADVDNYPLGNFPGSEDVDNAPRGVFNYGDALMVVYSDSWDDNPPTDCSDTNAEPLVVHGTAVPLAQCADGLRTWNQTVPGVFDGGFAFGPAVVCDDLDPTNNDLDIPPGASCDDFTNIGADGQRYFQQGTYVVQVATPPGYNQVKEEDLNVVLGLEPTPAILPPQCVGDMHLVPQYLSFATRKNGKPLPWADPVDHAAPFAGDERPLCDRKKVDVGSDQNAAVNFFLFTDVPKAARGVGLITDDLANALAPGTPQFVEKFSPAWISIAVFDYTGQEILRTYGDEFGSYNFLLPSTYSIDLPTPSGVGPKMHHYCLNHPTLPDGSPDPWYKPLYNTTCYTFQFEAGRTTYLDTPIIRQAAFVGPLQTQVDCAPFDGVPVITAVSRGSGPTRNGTEITGNGRFFIHSAQEDMVPNPDYPGDANMDGLPDDPPTVPQFITRDHGFGDVKGTVSIGSYTFPDNRVSWNARRIRVLVRDSDITAGLTTGQLRVARGDNGLANLSGVTMTVSNPGATIRVPGDHKTIQAAIDAASDGDLILVDPGTYDELPIVYKRVRLQGSGAGSTIINASHYGNGPNFVNPLTVWTDKIMQLRDAGELGLLPEQAAVYDVTPADVLIDGQGPGFLVSPDPAAHPFGASDDLNVRARIDGFGITRGDQGGGIYVNAYADHLLISNNKVYSNGGNMGGGIRVGNPVEAAFAGGITIPGGSPNSQVSVSRNQLIENGSQTVGGGIALFKGTAGYRITDNYICANLAHSGGGGIGHRGLSDGGMIVDNNIIFNEVFQGDQPAGLLGVGGGGGGIEIAGDPGAGGALTEGSGDVDITGNLLQGNLGGSTDGGGISLLNVNGQDVPADPHLIRIMNNGIVNNVSGYGGAGIGLQDAVNVVIDTNTISHNDSTALSVAAGVGTGVTTPQPAGVVSRALSAGLAAVVAGGETFSVPVSFDDNIIYQNRSFYWSQAAADDPANMQGGLLPDVVAGDSPVYWDLGAMGVGAACQLVPALTTSGLTSLMDNDGCNYTGNGNTEGDPGFIAPYFNILRAAAAADEGGNFVQVYYTPLSPIGDYEIGGP